MENGSSNHLTDFHHGSSNKKALEWTLHSHFYKRRVHQKVLEHGIDTTKPSGIQLQSPCIDLNDKYNLGLKIAGSQVKNLKFQQIPNHKIYKVRRYSLDCIGWSNGELLNQNMKTGGPYLERINSKENKPSATYDAEQTTTFSLLLVSSLNRWAPIQNFTEL